MGNTRWVAAAAAVVVILVFGAAERSGALWRDEARIDGGTIRSGTLSLRVGGAAPETQVRNYRFDGFGGTALGPASVVQRALTLRNAGDVEMIYRLQAARVTSSAVPLTLGAWIVGSENDCPAAVTPPGPALYSGPIADAQAPRAPAWAPALPPGGSALWCLRATVGADAVPNATTAVTFEFVASST